MYHVKNCHKNLSNPIRLTIEGSSAGRVKTKTIELVFSASPLSMQHKDIRSKVGLESG
jgi:hypothetical protein